MEKQLHDSYTTVLGSKCMELLNEAIAIKCSNYSAQELEIANRVYNLAIQMHDLYMIYTSKHECKQRLAS